MSDLSTLGYTFKQLSGRIIPIATTSGITSQWTPCRWCGNVQHMGLCPRVKVITYYRDGTIKRVEFHGTAPIMIDPLRIDVRKGPTL